MINNRSDTFVLRGKKIFGTSKYPFFHFKIVFSSNIAHNRFIELGNRGFSKDWKIRIKILSSFRVKYFETYEHYKIVNFFLWSENFLSFTKRHLSNFILNFRCGNPPQNVVIFWLCAHNKLNALDIWCSVGATSIDGCCAIRAKFANFYRISCGKSCYNLAHAATKVEKCMRRD